MADNIFTGLNWTIVAFAAGMATVLSVLMLWRARNRQKEQNLPLSPWTSSIPDVLLGTIAGVVLVTGVPEVLAALNLPTWEQRVRASFTAATVLSGTGGILGPKLWDLVSNNGMSAITQGLKLALRHVLRAALAWSDRAAPPPASPSPQDAPGGEHADPNQP